MKFILTEHAKKRCSQRKIKIEWIEYVINNPLRTDSDAEDDCLVHVLSPIPEKGFQMLRVIYNETVEPFTVVTAYFENEVIFP
jgi:Domain of unknown function (DUF4258)